MGYNSSKILKVITDSTVELRIDNRHNNVVREREINTCMYNTIRLR